MAGPGNKETSIFLASYCISLYYNELCIFLLEIIGLFFGKKIPLSPRFWLLAQNSSRPQGLNIKSKPFYPIGDANARTWRLRALLLYGKSI